ncbi:MAG: AmmeMemoRadiSam system protein B [Candidatus Aminicenantes bacterium]|nr:AmmeMemoRadiSam system protein B [Candidatus Aminicenantes bacterium]
MKRKPSVAGYFYPSNPRALHDLIERMVDPEAEAKKAICVVSPHAGYEYSGYVAGSVFSSVKLPEKFIIIGPNHRDVSTNLAIMKQGVWETPLGDVPINTSLAERIMENSDLIVEDERSHQLEHSLEVQVPFVQYFKKNVSIVPISIAFHVPFDELEELGKAISKGIKESGQEVLIIASTDMSHYVSQEEAKEKDFRAIEKILQLDANGLYDVVKREHISMCGYQPTVAALIASKELDAKKAELIKYRTSGDVSGNFSGVVGYAGIRIV